MPWLAQLREMPRIRAVMWSQLPSRGKVQQRGTGTVDGGVQPEAAAAQLREIIRIAPALERMAVDRAREDGSKRGRPGRPR